MISCRTSIHRQLAPITYIVKSTKDQKGKPLKIDLPFLKNDITRFFLIGYIIRR
jgi:hypothetical protein